jgi:alanyl-tRNA synthetase
MLVQRSVLSYRSSLFIPLKQHNQHLFIATPRLARMTATTAYAPISTKSQFGDWPANKVRKQFIDYFGEKQHTFVPSSSTIPYDDPTLLFANAGMNQYKSIFLGLATSDSPMGALKRAANSQKCIRAGGKHNDLDDVGKDTYHHTFFEMLGNWSFGDYFKREAITMAWELLTKVYGLPKDRLYVTYFEGDSKQGLEPDTEARDLWLEMGVAEDHLLTGDAKDNFWEMGATGPCGPCSEIHFDRVGGRNAAHLVNQDDPDVLEVWNLVFMAFNREQDSSLRPLPAKHIDTGMGFERLVSVLQDRRSNYDTDVFGPLFKKIQELTNARPYEGKLGKDDTDGIDTAYRVVADHVRTLTFAMSDGGVPDREGRGYVLRRILRRGTRYVRKYFQIPIGHFFSDLVPTLVEQMSAFFPELEKRVEEIRGLLNEEEESFARTLDRGEKLFEQFAAKAKEEKKTELAGANVWRLYDTFGFPVDLTHIMAEEQGLTINEAEFEKARIASYEASKGKAKTEASAMPKLDVHDLGHLEKELKLPKTDDSLKYGTGNFKGKILAIYQNKAFHESSEGVNVDADKPLGLILNQTNFYAESGGQQADTGSIVIDGKAEFVVEDVQSYSGYVLHTGYFKYGAMSLGDEVVAGYDELRRWPIRNNHTGTHILNFALREVLGDHIDQRGSLVAPTKLRFDFSHKAGVAVSDMQKIEDMCNNWVKKNVPVYAKDMNLDEAHKIPGLRAVFGEAYPDPVRVVSLEYSVDDIEADVENPKWASTSIEFCGGTHVKKTGDIKQIVVLEENGIAKGIRRVTAVTGEEARQVTQTAEQYQARLEAISKETDFARKEQAMKVFGVDLSRSEISVVRKAQLNEEYAKVRKAHDNVAKARLNEQSKEVTDAITAYFDEQKNETYIVKSFAVNNNNKALQAGLQLLKKMGKAGYLFSSVDEIDESTGETIKTVDGVSTKAKTLHLNYVPKHDIDKGLDARQWSETVCNSIGGKSGGKADSAQGVGSEGGMAVDDAMKAAKRFYLERCHDSPIMPDL